MNTTATVNRTVQDIRNHLVVQAATREHPRLYPTAVLNAENHNPGSNRSHITLERMMKRLDRSKAQANKYKQRNRADSKEHKGRSSLVFDESGFDNQGTYAMPTGATMDRLLDDLRTARAVSGYVEFHPVPLLGDAHHHDVLEGYELSLDDRDRFEIDDPAARVQKAGMDGGPVAALFNASITHANPTDAWLTAQLLFALDPNVGSGRVRIDGLMKELGKVPREGQTAEEAQMRLESLTRKGRRITAQGMLDIKVKGVHMLGAPTASMCAVCESWMEVQSNV